MVCRERERLLERYRSAVAAYAAAVTALKSSGLMAFRREYALADEARERCDQLRGNIENHRKKHGC